jgi:hypothetical protein
MTTNDKGFTKSARAARIDQLCAGHTAAPDYSANMRAAQQAVAAQLRAQP